MRDYVNIPDKEDRPFSYNKWKERGMLSMTPQERLLMDYLADMNSVSGFLFKDENGNSEQWWNIEDMKEFVKEIVPLMSNLANTDKVGNNSHPKMEVTSLGDLGENPKTSPSSSSGALMSNDHEGGQLEGSVINEQQGAS